MTAARTASMRTLWTALQGSAPIHDVSFRSVDSAEAVRRRLTQRLRLRSTMPGWRIEDRSRGPFAASEARWRRVGFGELLSVAAMAALFGVMLRAELASAQPGLLALSVITLALGTLPVGLVRRLRAERSARAVGDWVAQALAPVAGVSEPG